MTKEELLEYEMPSIAEYVSIGWLQTILARYTAKTVNRKVARWNRRQERKEFIRRFLSNTP